MPSPDDTVPATCRVRVDGVPAEMVLLSNQHWDDLLHELRLVRSAQDSYAAREAPARIVALITTLLSEAEQARMGSTEQALAALGRGEQRVTIDVEMSAQAVDRATELLALLDEADECAREGLLLTLPTPPAVRGFRHWFLDQMRLQTGRVPTAATDARYAER